MWHPSLPCHGARLMTGPEVGINDVSQHEVQLRGVATLADLLSSLGCEAATDGRDLSEKPRVWEKPVK